MFQTILIIAVVVLGILLWLARRDAKRHGTRTAEELVGICTVAIDTTVRKRANLDKILGLLEGQRELSNSEIRRALGVSSRTAVRYLDELENEGKVEQVGKIGHAVTYRLK